MRRKLSNKLKIEVFQQDWIPGFAAFMEGSVKHDGHAHVVLNIGSLLAAVASNDITPADLPYVIANCLMHEVVHSLEEWAGVAFSEKRVHALTEKYRAKYAPQNIKEGVALRAYNKRMAKPARRTGSKV